MREVSLLATWMPWTPLSTAAVESRRSAAEDEGEKSTNLIKIANLRRI